MITVKNQCLVIVTEYPYMKFDDLESIIKKDSDQKFGKFDQKFDDLKTDGSTVY